MGQRQQDPEKTRLTAYNRLQANTDLPKENGNGHIKRIPSDKRELYSMDLASEEVQRQHRHTRPEPRTYSEDQAANKHRHSEPEDQENRSNMGAPKSINRHYRDKSSAPTLNKSEHNRLPRKERNN